VVLFIEEEGEGGEGGVRILLMMHERGRRKCGWLFNVHACNEVKELTSKRMKREV
jgi:hypothetical protein